MNGPRVHFSLFRGGSAEAAAGAPPGRDVQELWLALARTPWSSLVLVPADEGRSLGAIANALAEVGGRLRTAPVTAIVADEMDFDSARVLSELQQVRPQDHGDGEAIELEAHAVPPLRPEGEADPASSPRPARLLPPVGQIVVAIQPVVVEPLGVAIARSADAVVLCFEMGRTRARAARRTIDLIGRERLAGAFVIR